MDNENEVKEKDKEEKQYRKRIRKFHMSRFKWYFKEAVNELLTYIKLLFNKGA